MLRDVSSFASASASAPGKVNLHLGVGDVMSDGYHELETVFCALSQRDTVTVSPSSQPVITVDGEDADRVPTDSSNLVWRAAAMVAAEAGYEDLPNVHLHIDKTIPVAGGMAGGSADAAAALVACNDFFEAGLSTDELYTMASNLGADVPFCLLGGTALGTHRGDRVVPVLHRTPLHWVMAVAHKGLSTPEVFREYDHLQSKREISSSLSADNLLAVLARGTAEDIAPYLVNDLQPAAISLYPDLRYTLHAGTQAGALAGIVSGSGPTCAFLCRSANDALNIAVEIAGSGVCRTVFTAVGPEHGVMRGGLPS